MCDPYLVIHNQPKPIQITASCGVSARNNNVPSPKLFQWCDDIMQCLKGAPKMRKEPCKYTMFPICGQLQVIYLFCSSSQPFDQLEQDIVGDDG